MFAQSIIEISGTDWFGRRIIHGPLDNADSDNPLIKNELFGTAKYLLRKYTQSESHKCYMSTMLPAYGMFSKDVHNGSSRICNNPTVQVMHHQILPRFLMYTLIFVTTDTNSNIVIYFEPSIQNWTFDYIKLSIDTD